MRSESASPGGATNPDRRASERLRGTSAPHQRSLSALGPLAVRIAQYLACRPDLVAERDVVELLTLVDETSPVSWTTISAILVEDLGAPVEECFEWISVSPERAGVLTQIHPGRLHDGTEVSVTVVRPGVEKVIGRGASLDELIDRVSDICGIAEHHRVNQAVETWLHEQVDLDRVFERAARLHQHQDRGFVFPAPHDEYSARRVLTADRLHGVPFTDLLQVADRSDEYFRDLGFDRRSLSDHLVDRALEQVFSLGLFSAGLHPSALIALSSTEIGVVDFATVDRVDPSVRDNYLSYVSSLRTGDVDRIVGAAQILLGDPDVDDLAEFRKSSRDAVHELVRATEIEGDGGTSFDRHLRAAVRLSLDHGIETTSEIVSANAALMTAHTVAGRLTSGAPRSAVVDRFFFRLQLRTIGGQLTPDNAQVVALDVLDLLTTGPGNVARLLGELADDRFILRVARSESAEDRRAGHSRARLIAAAIMIVATAIVVTGPDVAGASPLLRVISYLALGGLAAGFVALWVKLK